MSTSILSLDNLESFNSLSNSEQQALLSTVEQSELPKVLGNLRKLELYSQRPEAKWIRTPPWPKQELFLNLKTDNPNDDNLGVVKEAFFGGAAGGGKSDALLRAALQYVHAPRYAALILRTTAADLRKAGGLIPRSHEWLANTDAHWNGNESRWYFPGGSSLEFSYLSSPTDKYNFKSSEFQFIAFEELTDFKEEDYTYMFSRLRQRRDMGIPERIRSASNPGGPGHDWVKNRFISPEIESDLILGRIKSIYWLPSKVEGEGSAAIVPSKIRDNPAVDPVKYEKNLMHLSPVERERLMNGDWTIMPFGLIKAKWLRYFKMRHQIVELLVSRPDSKGNMLHTQEVSYEYDEREGSRYMVVDSAGGVEDIEREHSGKPLSYTAAGIFEHKRYGENRALLVRYIRRGRGWGYADIKANIIEVYKQWKPYRIFVEDKALGLALVSDLKGMTIPIEAISPGHKDKVARAAPFMNMMEQGQVYLPMGENSWKPAFEGELLGWLGRKDGEEVNDQVDIAAYAADIAGGFMGGIVKCEIDPRQPATELVRDKSSFQGGGMMKGWA